MRLIFCVSGSLGGGVDDEPCCLGGLERNQTALGKHFYTASVSKESSIGIQTNANGGNYVPARAAAFAVYCLVADGTG